MVDTAVDVAAVRALWRQRDFTMLWLGHASSQVGFRVGSIAVALLAVNTLSATAFAMGLLSAAQSLGVLLVGLPAGAWVDRVRRRRLMLAMDLVRAAVLLSVPLAALFGLLSLAQLVVVGLCVGVASVFFDVSQQSYLPALVGRDRLVDANAKLQLSQSVTTVGGPALGGALVAAVGASNAVLATGASFLGSAAFLSRIRDADATPAAPPDGRTRLWAQVGEGLRFVMRDSALRSIAFATATGNLFMSIVVSLMVLFLARTIGLAPVGVGLVVAAAGVGGVSAALTARWWTVAFGSTRTIWLAPALAHPFALLLPLAGSGWRLALFVLGWFVLGYGGTVYNVAQVSFRQARCPDHLLGRVQASNRFLAWGSLPIGGLLGGVLGTWLGPRAAMTVAAAGLLIALLWLVPLVRLGRDGEPDEPAAAANSR